MKTHYSRALVTSFGVMIAAMLFVILAQTDIVTYTSIKYDKYTARPDTMLFLRQEAEIPDTLRRIDDRVFHTDATLPCRGSYVMMIQPGFGTAYPADSLMKAEYGMYSFNVPDRYMVAPQSRQAMYPAFVHNMLSQTSFDQFWSFIDFRLSHPLLKDVDAHVSADTPIAGQFYFLGHAIEPGEEAVNDVNLTLKKGTSRFFLAVLAKKAMNIKCKLSNGAHGSKILEALEPGATASIFLKKTEFIDTVIRPEKKDSISPEKQDSAIVKPVIPDNVPPIPDDKDFWDEENHDKHDKQDNVPPIPDDKDFWDEENYDKQDNASGENDDIEISESDELIEYDMPEPGDRRRPWGRLTLLFENSLPAKCRISIKSNERLGDKIYIDKDPAFIPRNTVWKQVANLPRCTGSITLGVYTDVTYQLEITIRYESLVDFRTWNVTTSGGGTIILTDGLFGQYDCEGKRKTKQYTTPYLIKKIKAANVAANRHSVYGNHYQARTTSFIKNSVWQIVCDSMSIPAVFAFKAYCSMPWRRDLPRNNPFIYKDEVNPGIERPIGFSPAVDLPVEIIERDDLSAITFISTPITKLTVKRCANLEVITLLGNSIESLHIEDCPNLKVIIAPSNRISDIKIQGCVNVRELYCQGNKLENLNTLENLPKLRQLFCCLNDIGSLDLSRNPNLRILACTFNKLQRLDLSKNRFIKKLSCTANDNIIVMPSLKEKSHYRFLKRANVHGGKPQKFNNQSYK